MDRIERYFDIAIKSPDGIKKLRELILSLAMQGKLVSQDSNDPPAGELLKEIEAEKKKLIKEGKIKKQEPLPPIRPEEVPYALPAGWEWVKLNNFGVWKSGSTPSRSNLSYYGGEIPWVKSGEVKQGKIVETEETITIQALEQCSLTINSIGSVLVAMYGANIGEVGVLEVDAATNQAVCACKTYVGIHNVFLYRLIQSLKSQFVSQGAGAAQPNISREKIINTIVPLPPLAEQKRIVAKIDALMALCDKLEIERNARNEKRVAVQKAAVERLLAASDEAGFDAAWEIIARNFADLYSVPENVSDLKKAILQLAVMGKLVPQDSSDPPASELLKEIEAEKKKLIKEGKIKKQEPLPPIKPEEVPYVLPTGWEWVRFGAITINRDSERVPVSKENRSIIQGIYDYYGASGVIDKVDDYIFDKALLLIGEDGANLVNRSTPIAFIAQGKYWVNNHAHVIDGISYDLLKYIENYINSIDLKPYVTGTAQPKMNQAKMNSIVIALPPLAEQKRIVAKLDALMALCDELEQQLKDATDKQTAILNAVVAGM